MIAQSSNNRQRLHRYNDVEYLLRAKPIRVRYPSH